jgi:hypothetical protein
MRHRRFKFNHHPLTSQKYVEVAEGIWVPWLMPASMQVFLIHGDTGLVHDALQDVQPAPSQIQAAQPGAPTDIAPQICPICNKDFGRVQERDRHLRTFLPHWLFCPFELCPWRGKRYFNLKEHWDSAHASGQALPMQEHCEIYDTDRFVKLILCQLSTESAAEEARLEVERRAHELDKALIWADGWGRRHGKMKVHQRQ